MSREGHGGAQRGRRGREEREEQGGARMSREE